MKVWIITMAFPCPSETFAVNDVAALRKNGVEVSVHGLRPKHQRFAQLVRAQGLSEIWITHNSWMNTLHGLWVGLTQPLLSINFVLWILKHAWRNPTNLLKSLILVPRSLQIYRFAQQQQPDVIHLYWSHFPALVGYLIESKLKQIVVSISFVAHDVYHSEFDTKDSYTGPVARNADLIQTIAAANIPAIEKYGIDRSQIHLFYHGIDLKNALARKERIKRRIVSVGRLVPGKGFDEVLKAFSQVLQKWSDASLVILGDGTERERLEALARSLNISHAVDFKGFVSHSEIFAEMAVAEVFLFMSKAERLPNVVKEAMASHCFCVVSRTPGIEELICDRVSGYIVHPDDIEVAAQRICQAFSNPEKTREMTENAYQHIRTHFDLERIIVNLQEQWQQCMIAKQCPKTNSAIDKAKAFDLLQSGWIR